ncbi:inositol monophosphatase [Tribonema minus]|uniref:Inositol-1-monophosphatase n=1 Tax=Tribonema minus TaxID=303371 RepID=A0A835YVI1_9STRA|nr:inositol monophosphatase [Tribonema minus]
MIRGAEAIMADGLSRKRHRKVPEALTQRLGGVEAGLAERMETATELALAAGEAIKLVIDQAKDIENKGANDLVTATDKANEELIFQGLRRAFPGDEFIGEESSAAAGEIAALTAAPTWIVDPVDGTTNFVHGFPMTCVSIGFARGGRVDLGVIYNPCSGEMYQAIRGHGAWLNGKRIRASGSTTLAGSLVITEYGCQREEAAMTRMMDCTRAVLRKCRNLRQVGSGALDLAFVACGRFDAVYSGVAGEGWKPWDYAAGLVMAEEAGATMLSVEGQPFDLFGDSVLCCATRELAMEIAEIVRTAQA